MRFINLTLPIRHTEPHTHTHTHTHTHIYIYIYIYMYISQLCNVVLHLHSTHEFAGNKRLLHSPQDFHHVNDVISIIKSNTFINRWFESIASFNMR
jgi:hypothetical protein